MSLQRLGLGLEFGLGLIRVRVRVRARIRVRARVTSALTPIELISFQSLSTPIVIIPPIALWSFYNGNTSFVMAGLGTCPEHYRIFSQL